MDRSRLCWVLAVLAALTACVPVRQDTESNQVSIDWKDPLCRRIEDFAYGEQRDSLYPYLRSEKATYRYLALRGFASMRDSNSVDSLARLLGDPVEEVRIMGAYAIGLSGGSEADSVLTSAFARRDSAGKNSAFYTSLLEAIGRTGSQNTLKKLAAVQTYTLADTALLEGLAKGLYQFMLRDMTVAAGHQKMLQYATSADYRLPTRRLAANYINRAKSFVQADHTDRILQGLQAEKDAFTRINLIQALSKTGSDSAFVWIEEQLQTEANPLVKIALVKALGNFNSEWYQVQLVNLVQDKNSYVASAAADVLLQTGNAVDAANYFDMASDSMPWPVKYKLLAAANRFAPFSNEELRVTINNALSIEFLKRTDPYRKAALISALSEDVTNYVFIWENGVRSNHPTIKTASLEALGRILENPKLASVFRSSYSQVKKTIAGYILQAMLSGDAGLVSVGSNLLAKPELGLKIYASDSLTIPALEKTLAGLKMPAELESALDLRKCLSYLSGKTYQADSVPPPKAISWSALSGIQDTSRVVIRTSKGEIRLKLLYKDAPGTVGSFLELIQKRYFIQKRFHRVVPNFVIQGGCSRGDGYGSLDFTLRTEASLNTYSRAGMVGMASVGKDTESQQFFITQGPTPHLNGNYTIFAEVSSGQEIVDNIQVGDAILDIKFYP